MIDIVRALILVIIAVIAFIFATDGQPRLRDATYHHNRGDGIHGGNVQLEPTGSSFDPYSAPPIYKENTVAIQKAVEARYGTSIANLPVHKKAEKTAIDLFKLIVLGDLAAPCETRNLQNPLPWLKSDEIVLLGENATENEKYLELDTYCELNGKKYALEFQGAQHYSFYDFVKMTGGFIEYVEGVEMLAPAAFERARNMFIYGTIKDRHKANLCKKNGVELYQIPYHIISGDNLAVSIYRFHNYIKHYYTPAASKLHSSTVVSMRNEPDANKSLQNVETAEFPYLYAGDIAYVPAALRANYAATAMLLYSNTRYVKEKRTFQIREGSTFKLDVLDWSPKVFEMESTAILETLPGSKYTAAKEKLAAGYIFVRALESRAPSIAVSSLVAPVNDSTRSSSMNITAKPFIPSAKK